MSPAKAQPASSSSPGTALSAGKPHDAMPKISVKGLERTFGSGQGAVAALGPVDLEVNDGEFVCVVGPSGCGKSTLLRLIAGLVNPTQGSVAIRARSSRFPTAMVFQDYGIFPWKTVEANIRLGLDVAGVPRRAAAARAREWATRLGLAEFTDAYPATLSGGMRQRVSIARTLAVEPDILLMDEPFAALDAQMRLVMQDELLRLWESDRRTVLLVTHSLEEALLLGDRVIVMSARPGRILKEFALPFGRPRSPTLRGTPQFAALHEDIWGLLRDEVNKQSEINGLGK